MTATLDRMTATLAPDQKLGIIDSDVHPVSNPMMPEILAYLPEKWRRRIGEYGASFRITPGGDRPRHREYAHRWDTEPPNGAAPASNPDFAREQLLDRYDMSGAILNDIGAFRMAGAGGQPAELSAAICRAMNEHRRDTWLAHDPRWHASISLPYEIPNMAAEEIRFCREEMGEYNDRWKQLMFAPDNLRPAGHPSYWPIYEAAEHYGIPIGFHVLAQNRITPSGPTNHYFEEHCDFALFNFHAVSSLIYEGVFERFPKLKIALVELAWSWAVPFAWRLDHAFRTSRTEVPQLDRLPSEYLADHFYYTTQPMEEPENDKWFDGVLEAFEASGMSKNLMYSSDYPHWDFDEPAALPKTLSDDQLRRILGENARDLYKIDIIPDTGMTRL
ncbi:MAG: amidohydrolase [Frankiales bacterium]|nr:amidohydrolase [Frankiales bacterium]